MSINLPSVCIGVSQGPVCWYCPSYSLPAVIRMVIILWLWEWLPRKFMESDGKDKFVGYAFWSWKCQPGQIFMTCQEHYVCELTTSGLRPRRCLESCREWSSPGHKGSSSCQGWTAIRSVSQDALVSVYLTMELQNCEDQTSRPEVERWRTLLPGDKDHEISAKTLSWLTRRQGQYL